MNLFLSNIEKENVEFYRCNGYVKIVYKLLLIFGLNLFILYYVIVYVIEIIVLFIRSDIIDLIFVFYCKIFVFMVCIIIINFLVR